MTLDQARRQFHHLGFAVYAFEPGGAVHLEIHAPNGQTFDFHAPTLDAALALAFPPEADPAPAEPTKPINIFD